MLTVLSSSLSVTPACCCLTSSLYVVLMYTLKCCRRATSWTVAQGNVIVAYGVYDLHTS